MASVTEKNLVLVHSNRWQDRADFELIKNHVESLAPDIAVFIASNDARFITGHVLNVDGGHSAN